MAASDPVGHWRWSTSIFPFVRHRVHSRSEDAEFSGSENKTGDIEAAPKKADDSTYDQEHSEPEDKTGAIEVTPGKADDSIHDQEHNQKPNDSVGLDGSPIDSTHDQDTIDNIVRGTKRSLTLSHASDKESDDDTSVRFPRFASWTSDSHLYNVNGKTFTQISVEGCKEIFVPEFSVCFHHDETNKRDFWTTATPKGRRAPHWQDWRRWYGPSPNWDPFG